MKEIDSIMESESSARDKEIELKDLKKKIKGEFSAGLIIENHYLILEREADNAIGEIRTKVVTHGVAMPDELKEDVEEVLEDGVVTKEEYRDIMNRIRSTKDLNPIEKSKLNSLMTRWMVESKRDESSKLSSKPRRPETYKSPYKKAKFEKEEPEADEDEEIMEFDELE
jgi:hypothetical protein